MKDNHVVIQKAKVRLYTNSKKSAYNLKDGISEFLKNVIFDIIEEHLSNYESSNELSEKITVLNHLKLNVKINERNYKSQLSRLLLEDEIKKQLDALLNSPLAEEINSNSPETNHLTESLSVTTNKVVFSEADILQNSFLYFLKYGIIPWYCSKEIQQQLFSAESTKQFFTENKNGFVRKFLKICSEEKARQRFVHQLDEKLVINTLHYLFFSYKIRSGAISDFLSPKNENVYFYRLSRKERRTILDNLFELWYQPDTDNIIQVILHYLKNSQSIGDHNKEIAQRLFSILKSDNFYTEFPKFRLDLSIISEKGNSTFSSQEENREKEHKEKNNTPIKTKEENVQFQEEETKVKEPDSIRHDEENDVDLSPPELKNGLVVPNAGLIIIHPFLQTFFSRLDLLTEDLTLKDPELCVHLLHYLATGTEQDFEYQLAFEKIICNIPSNQPVERFIYLSEEMKKEADELLQVALDNWPILRNSGIELLRHEFLKREGAIRTDEQNIQIAFERKAQDILIDKLEWTLSFIKFPWLRAIIRVNW